MRSWQEWRSGQAEPIASSTSQTQRAGSNSTGYPKGAPKSFKGKGKGKSATGKSKGKMKGKQQAMAGEERVTEVTEETWQEDDGSTVQWPEGKWEEPGEQESIGAMFTNEGRSDADGHQKREVRMREKTWFTTPFVLVCNQSSMYGDGTSHCGHDHCRKVFDLTPWKLRQRLW